MEILNQFKNNTPAGSFRLAEELCRQLELLRDILASKGIEVTAYGTNSVEKFLSLPTDLQKKITGGISDYMSIVSVISDNTSAGAPKITIEDDIRYLGLVFQKYGLRPKDDITKFIAPGDIIEVYNKDWVQIYRNFEFFKNCSYSLMDLISNEWYVLYERPKQVIDAMLKCASDVVENGTGTVPFTTGHDHILRERYLNAKKAFAIKLKYITPLIDSSGKNVAVLTTLKAELVSQGDETSKIQFI